MFTSSQTEGLLATLSCCFRRRARSEEVRRIFVVRHGLKEDGFREKVNLGIRLHPTAYEGISTVRVFFAAREQPFGQILCSPMLRCRQTAEALFPGLDVYIEPGLVECLEDWAALYGQPGPDPVAQLGHLRPQIEALVDIDLHAPLMPTSTLNPEHDHGCNRLAQFAWILKERQDLFARGPLVLVTHGSPSFALIEALRDTSNCIIPVFDKSRMPEMASVTELVEEPDGSWRVVGNACPSQDLGTGAWRCDWTDGAAAAGADHTKL